MAEKTRVFHSPEELAAFLNQCGGEVQVNIEVKAGQKGGDSDDEEEGDAGAVLP